MGAGAFIPLINSRVVFDTEQQKMLFSGALSPNPRSQDYKNPFKGAAPKNGNERRISVSTIERVTTYESMAPRVIADDADLRAIFGSEPERLGRRPRSSRSIARDETRSDTREVSSRRSSSTVRAPALRDGTTKKRYNDDEGHPISRGAIPKKTFAERKSEGQDVRLIRSENNDRIAYKVEAPRREQKEIQKAEVSAIESSG